MVHGAVVLNIKLCNEADTTNFAAKLANCVNKLNQATVIYLEGDLGAGKTTFARGFIQSFGFDRVKSPTYTLVESYQNSTINIHHFDCYRLNDPEELDYIGIRDYLGERLIQLIEWPELGQGAIAPADLVIQISGEDQTRIVNLKHNSSLGQQLLECIER